jgi:hypothetical protein
MPMHRIKELAETRLTGYEIAPAARRWHPGILNAPRLVARNAAIGGKAQSGTEDRSAGTPLGPVTWCE